MTSDDISGKAYQQMADMLKTFNIELQDVKKDGNCLFRSISYQLEGNEDYHHKYRKLAAE